MKKRIVLTGGPGGGKTTAIDLLRREFSNQIVPLKNAQTNVTVASFAWFLISEFLDLVGMR